ncbi:MAG: radical SAM protein [Rickettsiales bacterium]|nr:radical SAM protein [Rickettsiales bacterium]
MKAEIAPRINAERTPLETVVPLRTPWVLFVDPASSCNFQCTFCPTGDRALMKEIGRYQGRLDPEIYTKILRDIEAFEDPIKVLRLYKDGEPLLHTHFAEMVQQARACKNIEKIDTTTNGVLLTPERSRAIIAAGIDRINISVDGLSAAQFKKFAKANVDFDTYVNNIRYLHTISGECEIVVKTVVEVIEEENRQRFFDIFGDYCDKIFIENTAPCWPDFDVEMRMDIEIQEGLYGNAVQDTKVCPYLFYSMSVNSDGNVSACFVDWSRGLIIGDAKKESLKDIWHSAAMQTHRMQHLAGKRYNHPICGSCGQLSHCRPDNVDGQIDVVREKFATIFANTQPVDAIAQKYEKETNV